MEDTNIFLLKLLWESTCVPRIYEGGSKSSRTVWQQCFEDNLTSNYLFAWRWGFQSTKRSRMVYKVRGRSLIDWRWHSFKKTVFFYCEEFVHHEFLQQCQIINRFCYLDVLRQLCQVFEIKNLNFNVMVKGNASTHSHFWFTLDPRTHLIWPLLPLFVH